MTWPQHLSASLPQLATVDEVAPTLGLTHEGVVRLCRLGKLPAVKVGHQWLINVRRLAEQLDGQATAVGSGASA